MKIAIVESFYAGSHRQWADQLQKNSSHDISLITLSGGRHWKWRMQSSAPILAVKANKVEQPDVYLCTDMINVAEFRSFLNTQRRDTPIYLYMHENQITYPWSPVDTDIPMQRDHTYGMINLKSCMSANKVFFNSAFHMQDFFSALPGFLQRFPDQYFSDQIELLRDKSQVLHIGMEMPEVDCTNKAVPMPPIVLWNHRWEYDKGPDEFFKLLIRLHKKGVDFRLIVCGKAQKVVPESFQKAKSKLKNKIIHWGYTDSKAGYIELLKKANVLPVTSHQDFFGISVTEAISHCVYPILPNRLAYPEHIPDHLHEGHLYNSREKLYAMMCTFLKNPKQIPQQLVMHNRRYAWEEIIKTYDKVLAQ